MEGLNMNDALCNLQICGCFEVVEDIPVVLMSVVGEAQFGRSTRSEF
jgi:hypothetical protein